MQSCRTLTLTVTGLSVESVFANYALGSRSRSLASR